ncbi:hypothetical protein [Streptomyces sp. RPT161]|uniref:hypothetical protein n=1 Tax=Streptomyces sp. RPT161 TaxID=3015993 RepID=UPI0022B917A2|nr:hypothetical protein [Streptomyces sp. RPT161]
MRKSTTTVAATLVATGVCVLGASTALAETASGSATPTSSATSSADANGYVGVSPDPAKAGQLVHIDGTCPANADAIISVSSPAFDNGGQAKLVKRDPSAFATTAHVRSGIAAKGYPVTVTCSVAHAEVPVHGTVTVAASHPAKPTQHPTSPATNPTQAPQVVVPRGAPDTGAGPTGPSTGDALLVTGGAVLALGGGAVVMAVRRRGAGK